MSRVLVTGVAGFIGSHVAQHCRSLGMDVVGVDDLSGGFRENIPPGVDFIAGDVCDRALVRRVFATGHFDYVYHLAAYAAEGLSHFIRHYNYTNNLIGSINLINESVRHDVRCFVFTSSIAVYGAAQTPMTEDIAPVPEDPYGVAKYAVELDLAAAHRMFGLPYVVFRPHNVYGERQNIADRYRNVIGIFMNQLLSGQPMTIFGDGSQTRAFSHIDDVAPAIAAAPLIQAAYQQVINIGADLPYSVLTLAHAVAAALGRPAEITFLPPRQEVLHAFASHEKAHRIFGPGRGVTLEEGLHRMAAWVRARGPAVPVTYDEIELPINLPPSWQAVLKPGPPLPAA
jgi:UDP-glucose 4-epimerase